VLKLEGGGDWCRRRQRPGAGIEYNQEEEGFHRLGLEQARAGTSVLEGERVPRRVIQTVGEGAFKGSADPVGEAAGALKAPSEVIVKVETEDSAEADEGGE